MRDKEIKGIIFVVAKDKGEVILMIDYLIGSLTIGLKLIGLMTPSVLLVMWLQWKDFGQPRIRLQDILPELREKENDSSTSRPASTPPTGGSGVPDINQSHINDKSIHFLMNDNWVSSPEYIAERLRQSTNIQCNNVLSFSPFNMYSSNQSISFNMYSSNQSIFTSFFTPEQHDLITLQLMFIILQNKNVDKK